MAIWRGAGGSGDATTDAANQASVASTKAAEAAASALAAAGSATAADTSDTQANDSKIAAATSATNSANSATASANSATASAASFDEFDDRYLGSKATAPTTDNDGDPLTDGVLYYDTVVDIMYVWNGSAWQTITTGSGGLEAANNLNDVASASTSRTNLGLAIGTDVQAFSSVLAGTTASYTTAEETKLAGIETAATADQTAGEIKTAYESNADTNAFTDAQVTKLSGIATSADVTGTTNVTAAGALMDSEVTNLAQVKAFDTTDYATAAQGALAASATQPATTVAKTSATGSAVMPTGTTAQRDGSPATGYLRFNSTDTSFEGYDGSAWGAIGGGGGASGGGTDAVFYENGKVITTSYSITADTNAMSTGPLTVNSGVSVTVPSGSRWVVL
jgi:hypothetical protein